MLIEKRAGFSHRALAVVHNLAQFQDLHAREFFAQDVAEAHLAFLMAPVSQRTYEQSGFGGLVGGQQAAHQLTRKTPGLAVVDADIGKAGDAVVIGGEGQHLGDALGKAADGFAHQRMVLRDQADACGLAFECQEVGGDGLRVKAFDAFDFDAEIGAGGGLGFDLLVPRIDEGVGARGQKESQLDGGWVLGRAVWRTRLRDIAQAPRGLQNHLARARPHTVAVVQHPVHRGR